MDMEQLIQKIATETNPYKVKSMKEKLSWMKAEANGNYITMDYLKQNRDMLIAIINRNLYYKTQDNLKAVMQMLVDAINEGIVYRTERGIKGILYSKIINLCEVVSLSNLGDDILGSSNRINYKPYNAIKDFYLNIKMK